jgi:RNA polymerase sigma-70 factor (ECF subfamily)
LKKERLLNELEAIHLVLRRNWSGLEYLIEHYQLRAVRAAYLVIGDQKQAEDIAIEAFYHAWEQIGKFDITRPFAPWFFTLLMNAARRSIERSYRFVDLSESKTQILSEFIQNNPDPEEVLIKMENQDEVRKAIARLPSDQRIAIVQKYYLGWTTQQISDQGGSSQGTIKWRLSQAHRKLRNWLRHDQENLYIYGQETERSQNVSR